MGRKIFGKGKTQTGGPTGRETGNINARRILRQLEQGIGGAPQGRKPTIKKKRKK